eukprot:7382145-Prymnesium_polylepis.1
MDRGPGRDRVPPRLTGVRCGWAVSDVPPARADRASANMLRRTATQSSRPNRVVALGRGGAGALGHGALSAIAPTPLEAG